MIALTLPNRKYLWAAIETSDRQNRCKDAVRDWLESLKNCFPFEGQFFHLSERDYTAGATFSIGHPSRNRFHDWGYFGPESPTAAVRAQQGAAVADLDICRRDVTAVNPAFSSPGSYPEFRPPLL